ncbi:DUF3289 family protein [Serratia ureilytica]|uniref:DUF3289 family protein n=1 Tax=Serratia ureilytica TaxID=300181 RepID=UPI0023609700|nr:DUF3289 family protein [Serratia ureilytica]
MRELTRPLTIFTSKKPFNDRFADDMQYGDMDERTLKQRYRWGKYQRLSIGVLINRPMIIRQREIFRQQEKKRRLPCFLMS